MSTPSQPESTPEKKKVIKIESPQPESVIVACSGCAVGLRFSGEAKLIRCPRCAKTMDPRTLKLKGGSMKRARVEDGDKVQEMYLKRVKLDPALVRHLSFPPLLLFQSF